MTELSNEISVLRTSLNEKDKTFSHMEWSSMQKQSKEDYRKPRKVFLPNEPFLGDFVSREDSLKSEINRLNEEISQAYSMQSIRTRQIERVSHPCSLRHVRLVFFSVFINNVSMTLDGAYDSR